MRKDFDYQAECGVWQCVDCEQVFYPMELTQGVDVEQPEREDLCPEFFQIPWVVYIVRLQNDIPEDSQYGQIRKQQKYAVDQAGREPSSKGCIDNFRFRNL